MSNPKLIIFSIFLTLLCHSVLAQADSTMATLQQIPGKYIGQVNKKIDRYTHRLTSKTEKTLTKLCRWENRVQKLLQKASPETAERLFANKDLTFAGLLEKLQQGKAITANTTAQYNDYRDKLTTSLKYLEQQKALIDSNIVKPVKATREKMEELEKEMAQTEAVQKFIKERKQQLISESIKYIGKSKYLTKINKESYYYVETLKNYKELFSDPKKAEQTAREILNKIPAFQKFTQQNSMLASLFGTPANYGTPQSLAGLQTRSSVNSLIQDRLAAGGPNAQQMMKEQMQLAQAEMNKMKDKLLKNIPSNGEGELPDFKPNNQRSKTFAQRTEYNFNLQFAKSNLLPSTADIGLGIGYKINDKSSAGVGMSYKLGMGSIQHISFTHQGIGLRSYLDWKLTLPRGGAGGGLFISGGFELNHNAAFKKINELKDKASWQQSGLIGLKKKLPMKTKLVKNTQVQLLYDILFRTHIPVSQPVVFRVGYGF
ncbi:hypothetical protein [Ferruginibacter sp. HRS2-29]|uniref:hypothetical protein n=1 Tax=Ferruginibacter sp. HRS2-29 TaxID=2487334 RepID=UPI0020CB9AE7|nr:hypothetical protein [Ferruginibacter sp. HRS2-29]MCP9750041.1 hypothetical protein [Ferruginibacter sp. HRS2-29]